MAITICTVFTKIYNMGEGVMSWFDILKMMMPREFMNDLQEIFGGEVSGGPTTKRKRGHETKGMSYELVNKEKGFIKLHVQTGGKWLANVNGKPFSDYNLKTLKEQVIRHLEEGK